MRAVLLEAFGGPGELVAGDLEDPAPDPGEVLIAVHAVGVNFADVLIRRGAYAQPPALPAVLGNEVAGTLLTGDTAGTLAVGDRVMALPLNGGGYAETVAVRANLTFPLPRELSFEAGAALLMASCTALLALDSVLRVRSGDFVLVHAAGGGVGTAAVQIASHLGAEVIATASSDERLRVAREAGAADVVDRRTEDFTEHVLRATGGKGVDSVVDPLGGDVLERSLLVIRPFGGLVAIGEAAGPWPVIPIARLVGRNIGIHGVYLPRIARHALLELRRAGETVAALAAAGTARPVVGATFPLEEAAHAHALIEAREHAGKVVLKTGAPASVR